MTALLGQQWRERRPGLVSADLRLPHRFIDVDEQSFEERPVEGLVEILRHRFQQPPRIIQQLQQHRDRLTSALHLGVADLGQALVDRCQLITQPPHLDLKSILRPFRVADQIEQVVLVADQPVVLGFQVPPQRSRERALLP
ncbi:hypothetical protein [Glycomyces artemisiae]|uniref:hypothetical protein n=1 Tax=Glycomyces artemisiae TaxID=1076443 RepID=UPI0011B264FB|nr:hypothetical protein [Glycomyces artemisiae]